MAEGWADTPALWAGAQNTLFLNRNLLGAWFPLLHDPLVSLPWPLVLLLLYAELEVVTTIEQSDWPAQA